MSGTNQRRSKKAEQTAEPLDSTSVDAQLAKAAMALVQSQCDDDVYDVIANFMAQLLPDAVLIINEVTPDAEHLLTRRVAGLHESMLAELVELVGFKIVGKSSAIVPEFRDAMLCGTLSRFIGGFAELTASEIPLAVSEAVTVLLGIQEVFTIGITDGDTAIGNVHILRRTSEAEVPDHAIEALARHCYSALARIATSRELAHSSESNRLLIDSMVEGLAVHDIILDDSGKPCDYRFLSVNPAFESLTGLRAADVVGRTVLDVLPGTEFVWIERYGAVATTGVPARFEDYAREIGRYFGIVAYSPQPGRFAVVFSDITERKEREQELLKSQLLLRASLESQQGTLLFSIDREYRYLYFNRAHADAMRQAYGQEVELGMCVLDCITSDADRVVAKANYDRALNGESHTNIRVFGVDDPVCYESFFNPMIDDEGEIVGATGLARDVTARVREEKAHRQNELRFAALFEQAPLGYQSLDENGCLIDVNLAWLDTLGFEREEVIGKWFGDFLAPEYVDSFRERFPQFKERGTVHTEFQMMDKDDDVHLVGFDGRIGYNPDGSFRQTHCILTDITERKRAEDALKESEDKFKYVFEHSVIAKSLTKPDGEVQVNEAFLKMLGFTREELAEGVAWQQLTHPDDVEQSERIVASLFAGEATSARFTKRYVHKDGKIVWGDVSTSLRRDAKGEPEYFMTSILDITERKRAEDELVRMNAELENRVQERTEELAGMNEELRVANEELMDANLLLEDATSAKSKFLASMSHELRTPLNSIIGFTGILRQGLAGPLTPEQELQLGMVSESGRHLLSLIDDILDLSRIESGKVKAHIQEFDVAKLVDSSLELIRPLAAVKGLELFHTIEPGAERFRSDPRFVSQILINLLGNATKFTDSGTVSVSVSTERGQMAFAVSDTGRGIREADMSHIMESFYQAEQVTEAKSRGTGLGLSISSQLAETLGGTLEVSSELGVGSTFTLRIPVYRNSV